MKNKFLTASNILDSLLKLSVKREDLYKLKMIQSEIVVKRESVDSYLKFLKNLKLEFPENKSELEKIINIVGDIQLKKSLDFKDESLVLGFFINKNIDFNYKGFKKEYYDDKAKNESVKKENYEVGTKERRDHTIKTTPGQSVEDFEKQVDVMHKKKNSMREAIAKMWGVDEGHNPFDKNGKKGDNKDMKKEKKTMTGQPQTKVEVEPKIDEKKK